MFRSGPQSPLGTDARAFGSGKSRITKRVPITDPAPRACRVCRRARFVARPKARWGWMIKTCSVVQPGDGFGGAPHAFGPGRTCGFYFRSREAFSLLGPQRGFHPLPSSPLSFATRRTPRRRPSWRPVVRTATRAPKSREWNCFASWKCRICTKRIRQCRKFKPPMKSHRCAV